jgi:[ribosomal protein S18]-alanine N-acetyltransferase
MTDEVDTPTQTHIRWMIRRDMPEVLSIEQRAKPNPWSEDEFVSHLRQRNCIGMVVEAGDKVVGFMVYELRKHKLHLLRMGVDPGYTGKDTVGKQIIEKLVSKLSPHQRTRLTVEVNETDVAQQQFLRSCGFEAVRILKHHFPDTGDDAYVMCLRCPELQTVRRAGHADRVEQRRADDEERSR